MIWANIMFMLLIKQIFEKNNWGQPLKAGRSFDLDLPRTDSYDRDLRHERFNLNLFMKNKTKMHFKKITVCT